MAMVASIERKPSLSLLDAPLEMAPNPSPRPLHPTPRPNQLTQPEWPPSFPLLSPCLSRGLPMFADRRTGAEGANSEKKGYKLWFLSTCDIYLPSNPNVMGSFALYFLLQSGKICSWLISTLFCAFSLLPPPLP
jgi:hypothetical protein